MYPLAVRGYASYIHETFESFFFFILVKFLRITFKQTTLHHISVYGMRMLCRLYSAYAKVVWKFNSDFREFCHWLHQVIWNSTPAFDKHNLIAALKKTALKKATLTSLDGPSNNVHPSLIMLSIVCSSVLPLKSVTYTNCTIHFVQIGVDGIRNVFFIYFTWFFCMDVILVRRVFCCPTSTKNSNVVIINKHWIKWN